MKVLLLSQKHPSVLEESLYSLPEVELHRSRNSSEQAFDCIIFEGYEEGASLPPAWSELLQSEQAVLLIADYHSDLPYLPSSAISEATLPVAMAWARQHSLLRRQSKDSITRSQQIIAHVTHELRSPLTVISLATQLALKSGLPEEKIHKHLGMVRESSKVLQSLVNDILDYSRMTSGKIELTSAEFDFHDLLNNVCESYRLLAEEKGLKLILDYDGNVPKRLVGDPGRLRQILANLLTNAVKFTPKGYISVFVKAPAARGGNTMLEFIVRDTGIGIPQDSIARIFQAYEQADDGTYHQYGGTGLGLSIARQLVEQMGGSVQVQSQVGRGSTFTFTALLGRVRTLTTVSRRQGSLTDLPVLVIQKNDASRRKLCEQLKDWGCRVWSTGERLNALRMATTSRSGLIIIDLDEWGFDFVEELRGQPGLEKTDFVVLTSAGQRGDGARCQNLKVGAYLAGVQNSEVLQKALELTLTHRYSLVTRHTVREDRLQSEARSIVTVGSGA